MVYEFEGRTEKEAIDRAAEELGLEKDGFDVEILETQRSGLFKKGYVKIQVHTDKPVSLTHKVHDNEDDEQSPRTKPESSQFSPAAVFGDPESQNEFEQKLIDFVVGLIERMGYDGKVSVLFREERKIGLKIDSEYSSILIGKKGKNLDALQLLANIYAGRQGREDMRVILDSENYRIRREESLVRLAYTVADRVRENRGSILLEPMNPFDRRLIHTTLNDIADVETKSEGEGLYKQVRVYYRGGMR
ncbi:spoiiij-associated protein [Treponema primitia ZAS-2]|uniref:RNA-binding protein KhpB n=1 Tax=Treponema primitia (strain ATCC BAA-887 / DSM 12427 / ZAS-2) TaxID=545694 RepID=F5YLD7_TREPZ|nr:RNA-binding cell elongation regulator Jag/EloR [Treponema primitia]AEF83857.1 spoiiij-associated protein [Treponema primitia ZAS-2]